MSPEANNGGDDAVNPNPDNEINSRSIQIKPKPQFKKKKKILATLKKIANPNNPHRRYEARARRHSAADFAFSRAHPVHKANKDEKRICAAKFPT